MDDNKIVELYWERREEAIKETALKYGRLCTHIAKNILLSCEDSEECVNDTYFAVWNAIPNERPNRFSAFISRITRNLALQIAITSWTPRGKNLGHGWSRRIYP